MLDAGGQQTLVEQNIQKFASVDSASREQRSYVKKEKLSAWLAAFLTAL
jgi:hypothetical protein